jgi:hypothetical protein
MVPKLVLASEAMEESVEIVVAAAEMAAFVRG